MRAPEQCKHPSSRTVIARGMAHRICNRCGMPLESPDLRASFVKHYEPTIGEIHALRKKAAIAKVVSGEAV